ARTAGPVADRGGFLERHRARLVRDRSAFPDADVLGVCARALDAEHLVADHELSDAGTDGFHPACELHPEDLLLRPEDPGEDAAEERPRVTQPAVRPRDRRRMDCDEDLVLSGNGTRDVFETENVR